MWMLVRRAARVPTHALTDPAFAETGIQCFTRLGSPLRLAHCLRQDSAATLATGKNGFFATTWMPAHILKNYVDCSRVDPVERLMRQGADQLACDGVEARITPEQVTRQTLKRRAAARTFQARSAGILERASAATLPGRQAGFSRGEEARWTGLGGDENLDEGL